MNATKYTLFMTVHDVFLVPGRGLVLAGTNEHMSSLGEDDLQRAAGKQIQLRRAGDDATVHEPLEVAVSTSIGGGKNLFILLPEGTPEPAMGQRCGSCARRSLRADLASFVRTRPDASGHLDRTKRQIPSKTKH